MRRAFALVIVLMTLLAFAGPAAAIDDYPQHCPDHTTTLKIEVGRSPTSGSMYEIDYTIDGPTVFFDRTMAFCVKAGPYASREIVGTSFTVGWLNDGGQVPDISYVVVYQIILPPPPNGCRDQCATPDPVPSTEPTPSPSPSTTPTPTPTPTPSGSQTSTPKASPSGTAIEADSSNTSILLPNTALKQPSGLLLVVGSTLMLAGVALLLHRARR